MGMSSQRMVSEHVMTDKDYRHITTCLEAHAFYNSQSIAPTGLVFMDSRRGALLSLLAEVYLSRAEVIEHG